MANLKPLNEACQNAPGNRRQNIFIYESKTSGADGAFPAIRRTLSNQEQAEMRPDSGHFMNFQWPNTRQTQTKQKPFVQYDE